MAEDHQNTEEEHPHTEEPSEQQEDISDEVRTFKITRNSLNTLYTDDEFDAGFTQGQILLVISGCLVYCGGMPLLYPLSLLILSFIYWYNKMMILKFTKNNQTFNEIFIDNSYRWLRLAIFILSRRVIHFSRTEQQQNNQGYFGIG